MKKNAALKAKGQPAGDCVDCNQCFYVCPTGVDIRDGLQIDCIQCGLCIDACDGVMTKLGRPTGLIGYDTEINVKRRQAGQAPLPARLVRARTILYSAIIALVGSVMLYALLTRSSVTLSALHDRNPTFVRLTDGSIRNAFTLRIANKYGGKRRFVLTLDRFDASHLTIVGVEGRESGWPVIEVEPDQTLEVRALITLPPESHPAQTQDFSFIIKDIERGETALARDHFLAP